MRRAVLYDKEDIRIERIKKPILAEGEMLVQNIVSTTCGTDVKNYRRGYPLLTPPHPFGHEFSGVVVDINSSVTKFKIGDRIVSHNTAPCNHCYYCKREQYSLCEDLLFNRGSYAEYVKIPKKIVEQNTFILPNSMSHKRASLLEPLSCAIYGVSQCSIQVADQVIVIGAGPIGLMMAWLVKKSGGNVFLMDVNQKRLEVAAQLGIKNTILCNEFSDYTFIKEKINEGAGVDVLIEATGNIEVWNNCSQLVRKGGKILFFGGTAKGTKFNLDASIIHYDQLTILGVFHTTPLYVQKAFSLLVENEIDFEQIFIQKGYTLDNLQEAIEEHGRGEVVKNYIYYEGGAD